jgi:prepilin-type N-terminal cleavage/methylation domain-containing protein
MIRVSNSQSLSRQSHKAGFSLIEILVVIVIVGILAGVGAPKLMGLVERSKEKTDVLKLYYLREALNKALLESEAALSKTTTAKAKSDKELQDLIDKMNRVLKSDAGATLFVIEVHNGQSVNVQNSHSEANNANNISEILGTSGTWCDAFKEAGFEGVADIVADRITGNYKKDTDTYTSYSWYDDVKDKTWQRTVPKKPMFISRALNIGKEKANTRYTMNVRWSDVKNPGHSLEVYLLPNGKKWNQAFFTDNGTCFSTYGDKGCNGR